MKFSEEQIKSETVINAAKQMMIVARTAPKAKGMDTIEQLLLTGDDLKTLAAEMEKQSIILDKPFFSRDAKNVLQSDAVILIGMKDIKTGLNCGYCGYKTCADCTTAGNNHHCVFTDINAGIAMGSAVSLAATLGVDTRILYSAGFVAQQMGMMPGCIEVLAVPLSAMSKSPYFDR